jgi:hypothetical protein
MSNCSCTTMHHRGNGYRIYKSWTSQPLLPGVFYTYDDDDMEKNKRSYIIVEFVDTEKYFHENKFRYERKTYDSRESLGLGDFFVFNLMILFILQPQWSITTKIFVVIGCIINIQVSEYGTSYLIQSWQLSGGPALPFPVIIYSLYIIILNVIIYAINIDDKYS